MYSKCVTCPKIGQACRGPLFVSMSAHDIIEWCKQRKAHLKLTNAKIAELSGMPKGTVDGLFAGDRIDFKFETIRPIIKVLTGVDWSDDPCPSHLPETGLQEIVDAQTVAISNLEEENARLQEELTAAEEKHKQELKDTRAADQATIEFMRGQLLYRRKVVSTLAISLGLTLFIIIGALIVDRLNPDVGFFWREFLFGRTANSDFVKLITNIFTL